MKITNETLDEAIAEHAVTLNRPGWLNQHVDAQRTAWGQLIYRYRDTPGKLLIGDFTEAICRLTNGSYQAGETTPPKPAHSIVPPMIVDAAVEIAAARHEQVRLSVEQHDDFWLIGQRNRLNDALARARLMDSVEDMDLAVDDAIVQFAAEADKVRAALVGSGYDDDIVTAKLAIIDRRQAEAVGQIAQNPPRFIDPADRPALPSRDEMLELERVWRAENE